MKNTIQRQIFFDKIVKLKSWKDSMSSKNEDLTIKLFDCLGYVLDKDYVRQYPVGETYVLDFAFINEQVAIESDGLSHETKKQKRSDTIRDRYLVSNNWVILRIKEKDLFGYKMSFYKNLIKEIVDERRVQYNNGVLYPVDFKKFNEEDYE